MEAGDFVRGIGETRPPQPRVYRVCGLSARGAQMLTAREAKVKGRYKQSFELTNLSSLEVERSADKPASLTAFSRWQSPG